MIPNKTGNCRKITMTPVGCDEMKQLVDIGNINWVIYQIYVTDVSRTQILRFIYLKFSKKEKNILIYLKENNSHPLFFFSPSNDILTT